MAPGPATPANCPAAEAVALDFTKNSSTSASRRSAGTTVAFRRTTSGLPSSASMVRPEALTASTWGRKMS
jgi:hypothetical protein